MFGAGQVSPGIPNDIVTLISLRGPIVESAGGGGPFQGGASRITFQQVEPLIEQAFALEGVKAVLLAINCPGGSPVQTNMISNYIREQAEKTNIPVYALVEDLAASGGYWLACSADEIFVDPSSMVGSIGVIYQSVGASELMKNYGVEAWIITSAENKAGLSPMLEYDKTEANIIAENMGIVHDNFVEWVKNRRPKLKKDKPKGKVPEVFSGKLFVGDEAVKLGLADGLSNLSQLLSDKFPNNDDLTLIEVKRKQDTGLFSMLGPFFESSHRVLDQIGAILDSVVTQVSEAGPYR